MKTVKEILEAKSHKLLAISPQASVLDALKLMADRDVGALVVLDSDGLAGIFSDTQSHSARQVLQGDTGERDHDAQGRVRTSRPECRGVYGVDDRQAYPAPPRVGRQEGDRRDINRGRGQGSYLRATFCHRAVGALHSQLGQRCDALPPRSDATRGGDSA